MPAFKRQRQEESSRSVESQLRLDREFEASLSYLVRLCLKQKEREKKEGKKKGREKGTEVRS